MKSIAIAVAAVSLLQIAGAQPHRRRHVHERAHQNAKKDEDVVVTIVDTVYAQATETPEVIIYVNQDGVPFSTTTEEFTASIWTTVKGATPTPSLASTSSSSSSSSSTTSEAAASTPAADVAENAQASPETPSATLEAAPVSVAPAPSPEAPSPSPVDPSPAVATPEAPAPSPAASSPAQPDPSPASPPPSSGKSGFGVSYSPYNGDGTCKTQDQVNKDFEAIGDSFAMVRIYGTDCNQAVTVLSAAKQHGMKLFAGVYDISKLSTEIAALVAAAQGDWSSFDTISIGNELVNSGTASASAVVAAIGTARGLLKTAGYNGKVVTVDTLVAARANPSLCDASDFCAVNCHPFFDGNVAAADSGKFLNEQIPTLQAKLANKSQQVMITETGWPWQGQTNGAAVPSLSNQAAAISSIKSAYAKSPEAVILFTAFNDLWKSNSPAQFQAEQFWGMGGNNPPSG